MVLFMLKVVNGMTVVPTIASVTMLPLTFIPVDQGKLLSVKIIIIPPANKVGGGGI